MRVLHCLVALTCLTATKLSAQSSLPADQVEKIGAMIGHHMARLGIPGLSAAVALDGEIRYSKAFGKADLENQVPATVNTLFRTASIAKSLTATAVMQLAEAGKIDLDGPVQKHCPAFPEKPWPVSVRQLLGHLAGIRHYEKPHEARGTEHFFAVGESLRLFKDDPLKHEPGTKCHYSTFGYSVPGCAVEGASRLDHHFQIIPSRARGYMRVTAELMSELPEAARRFAREGDVLNAPIHDTSMKVPGGGLLSTSEDLVRFAPALEAGRQ